MTELDDIFLNQKVNPVELEKAVDYMTKKITGGMASEEAISWAAIRYSITVVKLRKTLKDRGLYNATP